MPCEVLWSHAIIHTTKNEMAKCGTFSAGRTYITAEQINASIIQNKHTTGMRYLFCKLKIRIWRSYGRAENWKAVWTFRKSWTWEGHRSGSSATVGNISVGKLRFQKELLERKRWKVYNYMYATIAVRNTKTKMSVSSAKVTISLHWKSMTWGFTPPRKVSIIQTKWN